MNRRMDRRKLAGGFTLLELVVVLAILATLAGLVVSKVDWTRRQADMAASADTCVEIAKNIQMYLNEVGDLPNGMDSLLGSSGARYSKIVASSPDMTKMTTVETFDGRSQDDDGNAVSDGRMKSLSRIGLTMVFDHDESSSDAPNSGTVPRELVRSGANKLLCVTPGSALWNSVYPVGAPGSETDETNVSLAVFGIGPGCSMIGKTMTSAPQYPHPAPREAYYRYMVVIAAYQSGERAQFKTVVDSFGRTISGALSNYYGATPE